jgi:hypothetical protein
MPRRTELPLRFPHGPLAYECRTPNFSRMPNLTARKTGSRKVRSSVSKLGKADIQRRLEVIELTTVSSVRALQMDIEGDEGVPSSVVLKRARAALK